MSGRSALPDERKDGIAVVATIRDGGLGDGQSVEQRWNGGLVGRLPRRDEQPHGQTVLVHDGVDLGAQSATRTADGVIRTPFLPPAACWCARTIELSIRCSDCGERAASASNMATQTLRFAQRLKRL